MSKSKKTNLPLYIGIIVGVIIIVCIVVFFLLKPKQPKQPKPIGPKTNAFPNITDVLPENFTLNLDFDPNKRWKEVLKVVYDKNLFSKYIKLLTTWIENNEKTTPSCIVCDSTTLLVLSLLGRNTTDKLPEQTAETKKLYNRLMELLNSKLCDFENDTECKKAFQWFNFDSSSIFQGNFMTNLNDEFFSNNSNSTILEKLAEAKLEDNDKNKKAQIIDCKNVVVAGDSESNDCNNAQNIGTFFKDYITSKDGSRILTTYNKSLKAMKGETTAEKENLKKSFVIFTDKTYIEPIQIFYNSKTPGEFGVLKKISL